MTHASVFSGIGGPEVAATMLGWDNLFHCEINPFGRKVLDYWYPNSKSYEDITTTDFTEWRGRVDVLTGGFPCQPFSYAGRRRGAEDDRYLWPSMYRAIDEIQPTWVVAENVAGILTMVEQGEVSKVAGTATLFDAFDDLRGRFELRETFTLQRICTDLESHGYAVQPVLVPACAVGAPHRRDRVFIVARRKDAAFPINSDNDILGERFGRPEVCEPRTRQFGGADSAVSNQRPIMADTDREGLERPSGERVQGHEGRGQRDGLRECPWQSGETRQTRIGADGITSEGGAESIDGRNATDTMHGNVQDFGNVSRGMGETDFGREARRFVYESLQDGETIGSRWQDFPSVSPVHRGNDGLPFDVDRLTLSFGKWRTEALKAYGNAIVPQVMYEIFRAIQQVETPINK